MPKVVFQPSASKSARKHYDDTIEPPVDLSANANIMGAEAGVLAVLYPSGKVPIWGITPGQRGVNVLKYSRAEPGDVVLFTGGGRAFAGGVITHKWRSPRLARKLWGVDQAGQTWEQLYALTDMRQLDIPYASFNAAAGYKEQYNHLGFNVTDEEAGARVLQALGADGKVLADASARLRSKVVLPRSVTAPRPGSQWTPEEISAVIDTYFVLLRAELASRPSSKADAVRGLMAKVVARTRGSIEYKLENITAVLDEEALPWIDGYKPARNYQRSLRTAVIARLATDAALLALLEARQGDAPAQRGSADLATGDVMVRMPTRRASNAQGGSHLSQGARGALKDAANRRLGKAGEEFVVGLERTKLRRIGRQDLADKVDWVADTQGDGLGFDILSFDERGGQIHIEVKTTNLGSTASFFVTAHELAVSKELAASFWLYRVFDFAREPRLYVALGPLDASFDLQTSQWVAHIADPRAPTTGR